jgi:hypothetical protein
MPHCPILYVARKDPARKNGVSAVLGDFWTAFPFFTYADRPASSVKARTALDCKNPLQIPTGHRFCRARRADADAYACDVFGRGRLHPSMTAWCLGSGDPARDDRALESAVEAIPDTKIRNLLSRSR